MVDVNLKPVTRRTATASALVSGARAEPDQLVAARLAGEAAAKRTQHLIPLCHQIPLDETSVVVRSEGDDLLVEAKVTTEWRTGVEMEALTAVTVAALCLVAGAAESAVIGEIAIESKTGGRSGDWGRANHPRTGAS